ncbi:reverse transcriptase domain-containing protein [Tanacetum coccineum]
MPAPDLRTVEELCQPTMNGQGGPIAPVNIQATEFELKNNMIQQSMKQNGVTDDAFRLYLFPYSLTHHAIAWFDHLPNNSIHTFQEMASKFLSKYFPPSMVTKLRNDTNNFRQLSDEYLFEAHRDTINAAAGGTFMKRRPEECYDLIENMTAHHNDWVTSAHRCDSSSSATSSSSEIASLAQQMIKMRKDMLQMYRSNQQVNSVTPSCETCGCPHSYYECQAAGGYTQGNCNLLSYRSNNFLGPPGFNPPNNQNQGNGYSRKGTKRKPKANKTEHGMEKTKSNRSQSQPSEENTT